VNGFDHPYAELNARLGGRGVPSVEREIEFHKLTPVVNAYRRLVNGGALKRIADIAQKLDDAGRSELMDEIETRAKALLDELKRHTGGSGVETKIVHEISGDVHDLLGLADSVRARATLPKDTNALATLAGWLLTRRLGEIVSSDDGEATSRRWLNEWPLGDALRDAFRGVGMDDQQSWQAMMSVKLMMAHRDVFDRVSTEQPSSDDKLLPVGSQLPTTKLQTLFDDPDAKVLLQTNQHDGAIYFSKEAFEQVISALHMAATFERVADADETAGRFAQGRTSEQVKAKELISAAEQAGYQVERLLTLPYPSN
jgi:hypothetical protein